MKRKFYNVLYVSILFFSTSLFAQNKLKLNVDAGYTYSSLNTNLSNLIDSKYIGRYGFGANLSAELSIFKSLFISSGFSYLQKNYEFTRTGARAGWYTKYDNEFLSLPLLIGGYLINNPNESNGVWIKVAGGMYTDYWLSMKREGQYPVFFDQQPDGSHNHVKVSDKYDFKENENNLRRFGYGLQGQAQLGYSFNKLGVYVSYNYQYGLSDIKKDNINRNQKMTINSYMLSTGLTYKFN
ncbi:Outer membrane protein beta-barrel domain-containing protein [Chishuiella changwenlii]|uniref:Outer membrane protein beta-barrel domain-containing protein n=1 Tax=Chishuiella changwenlii TaxID=1434701 RepID=A0A1M6T5D9_9FLAO|nr:outer membrane beta-barrel protein [Chishuiella changwenlii]GGE94928.1 hypothetical protein GCM10010984_10610 [Chishuiella changwenlii]SHK52191.1 Outer membrane protein beta-barrel domain-containing protein [Chishuiella changwenlii]